MHTEPARPPERIRDRRLAVTVILKGDAENREMWNNPMVRLEDEENQTIDTGTGIDIAAFALVVDLESSSQRPRDRSPPPGETLSATGKVMRLQSSSGGS
jgi:hypothetical protein